MSQQPNRSEKTADHSSKGQPAPAPAITAATMPESFETRVPVTVPTLRDRVSRAQQLLELAAGGFGLSYAASSEHHAQAGSDALAQAFRQFTGRTLDTHQLVEASGHALREALTELFWILRHPEPSVLDVRVPTDEQWQWFCEDRAAEADEAVQAATKELLEASILVDRLAGKEQVQ